MCVTGYQTRNADSMHSPQSCSTASTLLIQWQHLNTSYSEVSVQWKAIFSLKPMSQLSLALRWAGK